nr:reverse transcriptase domain-containing protein [Tanacetum cinerariifolium]
MSVRLADRSFSYPVGIVENMLVEVGKFTFPLDFIILEIEEDMKVPLILGIHFLHTVAKKILMLYSMKEEKSFTSIKGTPLEDKIFVEFDEFIAMHIEENTKPEINEEELTFKKITFDTVYKIKTSLEEPPTDLKLQPLPDHLEYAFLKGTFLLHVIISS